MAKSNSAKEAIKAYLDQRAETDPQFAASYAKPNKSIDRCFDYIMSELAARRRRIEARLMAEEKKRQAAKHEAQYRKDKGAYFGICFQNDDIKISVIQSVTDMAAEGEALHHCVYAADYYKRPDSLILSARRKDNGQRLETIEVSLTSFKVVQSRANCNGISPEHKKIIALVNKNMDVIRQIKMIQ